MDEEMGHLIHPSDQVQDKTISSLDEEQDEDGRQRSLEPASVNSTASSASTITRTISNEDSSSKDCLLIGSWFDGQLAASATTAKQDQTAKATTLSTKATGDKQQHGLLDTIFELDYSSAAGLGHSSAHLISFVDVMINIMEFVESLIEKAPEFESAFVANFNNSDQSPANPCHSLKHLTYISTKSSLSRVSRCARRLTPVPAQYCPIDLSTLSFTT